MCFACGKDNPIGLKIKFEFDGEVCRGEFTPNQNHLSWEDTVHGGIIYSGSNSGGINSGCAAIRSI